ncbi:anthocyanidin 3-O-glucosyltransferase 2-like [Carica papaya]|uniref:anthocyanidin 3-O-glucosyltransferase 2-like n=1 Tax=Carica papaya TaxID=3649 RepID=UPI000B8C89DD|nr:anthocyanidin 3-O-glucosyltransferase 2-like [Carica papaya]
MADQDNTKKAELVFLPTPGLIGHLVSTIGFVKRLLDRDDRFSVTVLVIKPWFASDKYSTESLAALDSRVRYITLPSVESSSYDLNKSPDLFLDLFVERHKPYVKEALVTEFLGSNSARLVGLVVDMFCSPMIELANELDIPCYIFYTSSAAILGLILSLSTWHDQTGLEFEKLNESESVVVPSYSNPVPVSVLPSFLFEKYGYTISVDRGKKFKRTKGIIVNTFADLEPHAMKSLSSDGSIPAVYTVGPIVDIEGQTHIHAGFSEEGNQRDRIMEWLEAQPPSSVVFLCFGSVGIFDESQLKQIAIGLERSGLRFLWPIRRPKSSNQLAVLADMLPDGFLERTRDRAMVCEGWAPQAEVLAHRATGAFLTHCGWNSILESVWCGVPMVTWPMYAEQQINSFEMVKEAGLAMEMRLDYRKEDYRPVELRLKNDGEIVMADEIEKAVVRVMSSESEEMRRKVKEMSVKSREVLTENGSSFDSLGRLIRVMLGRIN